MNDLTFELRDKLTFANLETGEDDETMEILLRAPTFDDRCQYARIHSHAANAFVSMAGKLEGSAEGTSKDVSTESIGGEAVLAILSAGSRDFDKVLEDFVNLAVRVGRLNDKTPLVEKHLRDIGVDALMRMCGEYIAFFVMPSLLSMTSRAGSER